MLIFSLALAVLQTDTPSIPQQGCRDTYVTVETTYSETWADCVFDFGDIVCADGNTYPRITKMCVLKQGRIVKKTRWRETPDGEHCQPIETFEKEVLNVGTSSTEVGAICPEVQAPGSCCIENGQYHTFTKGDTITRPSWSEQDCPDDQNGKIKLFTLDTGYWETKTDYTRYRYNVGPDCPPVSDPIGFLLCLPVPAGSDTTWVSTKKETWYTYECVAEEEEEEEEPEDKAVAPDDSMAKNSGSDLPMAWEHLLAVN